MGTDEVFGAESCFEFSLKFVIKALLGQRIIPFGEIGESKVMFKVFASFFVVVGSDDKISFLGVLEIKCGKMQDAGSELFRFSSRLLLFIW